MHRLHSRPKRKRGCLSLRKRWTGEKVVRKRAGIRRGEFCVLRLESEPVWRGFRLNYPDQPLATFPASSTPSGFDTQADSQTTLASNIRPCTQVLGVAGAEGTDGYSAGGHHTTLVSSTCVVSAPQSAHSHERLAQTQNILSRGSATRPRPDRDAQYPDHKKTCATFR